MLIDAGSIFYVQVPTNLIDVANKCKVSLFHPYRKEINPEIASLSMKSLPSVNLSVLFFKEAVFQNGLFMTDHDGVCNCLIYIFNQINWHTQICGISKLSSAHMHGSRIHSEVFFAFGRALSACGH